MSAIQAKEKILSVATRLFKEKGFPNVSVREICQTAKVSLPMVYYYFKDKRGLFQAVSRESITLQPLLVALREINAIGSSSEKKLQKFVEVYLASFPKDLLNAGLYMREKTDFDRASMHRFANDLDQAHALMSALISEGIVAGEFRETDAGKAADCVLGMMHRAISQQAHFHRHYDPGETSRYVAQFALSALRAGA